MTIIFTLANAKDNDFSFYRITCFISYLTSVYSRLRYTGLKFSSDEAVVHRIGSWVGAVAGRRSGLDQAGVHRRIDCEEAVGCRRSGKHGEEASILEEGHRHSHEVDRSLEVGSHGAVVERIGRTLHEEANEEGSDRRGPS